MRKFALVTPLRNEVVNIPRLFASMEAQSLAPHTWVIVNDGSDDGSAAQLEHFAKGYTRGELIVQDSVLGHQPYALGEKYARVVQQGMDLLRRRDDYRDFIAVGINDADCFPEPAYFKRLVSLLEEKPRLGITSGLERATDNKSRSERLSWVRGNCRLWRRECLDEVGYIVGPSADTVSLCKARLTGWDAHVQPGAFFSARPLGARTDMEYYGRSAHYRGIGPSYALLKATVDLMRGRHSMAMPYLLGYFRSWASGAQRISDPQIRHYYRWYLLHLLRELPQEWALQKRLRALLKEQSLDDTERSPPMTSFADHREQNKGG